MSRNATQLDHLGDFTATSRVLRIAALAMPIGALGALVSWALLRLIGLITNVVFYQRLRSSLVAPGQGHHPALLILLAPIAGGLIIGLIARFGSEKVRGHGIPEAIESILVSGSRVQPRVAALKPLASAIAIGTGGPFGAEGPIIMTGGAFGSLLAQFLHLTADERKTLLVAGAAAGMAATFNAPLASVLLAVELLLFEWRPRSFVPVVAAVAFAIVVRTPLLGSGAIFLVKSGPLHLGAAVYGLCVLCGVLAGLLALGATTLVYAAEEAFQRLKVHWMWWPAIGGAIVGLGGLAVPQALGVGYNVIKAELTGSISLQLIVGILLVKTLIWSLSLGSGTSGGVLAPMLMIGGALGGLEASVFPAVAPGFWALIALAGVLGGVMRSPLTGVAFAIELTHRYEALLPLLIGATTAFLVSVLLLRRSVLTEKIARRGLHLSREYSVDPLEVLFVHEVMSESGSAVSALPAGAVHVDTDDQFTRTGDPLLHTDETTIQLGYRLVRESGTLVHEGDTRLMGDPLIHTDDTLRHAANVMAQTGRNCLAVSDRRAPTLPIGTVTLQQLLQGRLRDLHEERHSERALNPLSLIRRRGRTVEENALAADR